VDAIVIQAARQLSHVIRSQNKNWKADHSSMGGRKLPFDGQTFDATRSMQKVGEPIDHTAKPSGLGRRFSVQRTAAMAHVSSFLIAAGVPMCLIRGSARPLIQF
jgi:hypothetical protein